MLKNESRRFEKVVNGETRKRKLRFKKSSSTPFIYYPIGCISVTIMFIIILLIVVVKKRKSRKAKDLITYRHYKISEYASSEF